MYTEVDLRQSYRSDTGEDCTVEIDLDKTVANSIDSNLKPKLDKLLEDVVIGDITVYTDEYVHYLENLVIEYSNLFDSLKK